LLALQQLGELPEQYLILERSADLRQRQQQLLAERVPELAPRILWLDSLPDSFQGMILANEVLDALPVERFRCTEEGLQQAYVVWTDQGFITRWQPAGADLRHWYDQHLAGLELAPGYQSECCPLLNDWLAELSRCLAAGVMLFVDYGYVRREYYHPERAEGTLMCHYRHRAHPDPYLLPGLQDITAYVDFTAVAEAADAAGLHIAAYTTQAHYLLDVGVDALLADVEVNGSVDYFVTVQAVKQLLLPGEMGERFKAILLTRGLDETVPGFRGYDQRSRL
jgi:SAM-dependent MidA family methyltransferase